MRSITHPGLPDSNRICYAPSPARAVHGSLSSGRTLIDAVNEVAQAHQAESGAFTLNGGAFTSFSYVMPALSKIPHYAVYFSETFHVEGRITLETAALTYGVRDGQP